MKTLIEAGCNPAVCGFQGRTVLEAAVEAGYTSVVEHLLSCNVPVLPYILPIALRRGSTVQMIQILLRKGADACSAMSNGNNVVHLAIAEYPELPCLDLVKTFIFCGKICSANRRRSWVHFCGRTLTFVPCSSVSLHPTNRATATLQSPDDRIAGAELMMSLSCSRIGILYFGLSMLRTPTR